MCLVWRAGGCDPRQPIADQSVDVLDEGVTQSLVALPDLVNQRHLLLLHPCLDIRDRRTILQSTNALVSPLDDDVQGEGESNAEGAGRRGRCRWVR